MAVLIPCFNGATTIAQVIADFRSALPADAIYVYDNNSIDRTVEIAQASGAFDGRERRQGKGNVVRQMFRDIDAEVYVLVDGHATYDAASAPALIHAPVEDRCDMVVGARVSEGKTAYRLGHRFGNRVLTGFVRAIFGTDLRDMLSGYRMFSRRVVKSFPALSTGFETELTVHALELEMPVAEIDTPYYARPGGSTSKLNTWRDGVRIMFIILELCRSERPLAFYSLVGAALAILSIALAIPIFVTNIEIGLVPKNPTAILSTGLMILAFPAIGLVLDTVTRGHREMKLLAYVAQPPFKRR